MVVIVTGAVSAPSPTPNHHLSHFYATYSQTSSFQNRGIGLAICESLLTNTYPIKLYAASRAGIDLNFKHPSHHTTVYPKLDITSQSSLTSLYERIKADDGGNLDILINNAGVNTLPDTSPPAVKKTLDTNYRGTLASCQTLLPLMKKGGRVVNVSSVGSDLHIYSKDVQERFRNRNMTLAELEDMAQEYQGVVDGGKEDKTGWGGKGRAYSVSKACVNALTRVLARENDGVKINCCCPGWVDTDMGSIVGRPSKSAADGAKIPVRLAVGDIGGATGEYWGNPSIHDTGDGEIQKW